MVLWLTYILGFLRLPENHIWRPIEELMKIIVVSSKYLQLCLLIKNMVVFKSNFLVLGGQQDWEKQNKLYRMM